MSYNINCNNHRGISPFYILASMTVYANGILGEYHRGIGAK